MDIHADVVTAHYPGEIPDFVEREMERLYGSVYSSMAHFRIHGGLDKASTYVARRDGRIVALFLFRREWDRVRVINEGVFADAAEIDRFADHVFAHFPWVTAILFHAFHLRGGDPRRPCQRIACGEDIVADLPAAVDDYVARLGSATRKNIRKHLHRIERDFPTFRMDVLDVRSGDVIDEGDVRAIIGFNHARMDGKGKVSVIDERKTANILRLARQRGFMTRASIDGRICAGTIGLRIGDTVVSLVNAHDPHYDDHRLGTVCCFLTVCAAIERGARRFDFMWGRYDYKTALLGAHHELSRYIVYRSRLALALNGVTALRTACAGRLREAKLGLLARADAAGDAPAPLLIRCVNAARRAKKALQPGQSRAMPPDALPP